MLLDHEIVYVIVAHTGLLVLLQCMQLETNSPSS